MFSSLTSFLWIRISSAAAGAEISLDAWSSYFNDLLYLLPDYLLPPILLEPLQLRHRDPLEPRQAVLRVARQQEDGDPGLEAAVVVVDDVVLVDDPTSGSCIKIEYRAMRGNQSRWKAQRW